MSRIRLLTDEELPERQLEVLIASTLHRQEEVAARSSF